MKDVRAEMQQIWRVCAAVHGAVPLKYCLGPIGHAPPCFQPEWEPHLMVDKL